MIIILMVFIAIGAFCFVHAKDIKENVKGGTESNEYKYNVAGAMVSFVIALAYLICMCCCWNNIALGASIMEAASDFVTSNIRVIFLPVIAYFLSVITFIMWIYSAVYIWCIGEPEYRKG